MIVPKRGFLPILLAIGLLLTVRLAGAGPGMGLAVRDTPGLGASDMTAQSRPVPPAAGTRQQRRALLAANTLEADADSDAEDGRIAVLYPDLGEPYRSVFRQILSGIEQTAPTRVLGIPLPETLDPDELAGQLKAQGIAVVIALGRHGLKAASALPPAMPVVGGAVLASPDDGRGARTLVSLTPDPRLLIQHLKRMAPSVRRVFTVYSARQNDWLIDLARQAARAEGIELVAIETDDLSVALQHFHDITNTAQAGRDAIWLPQDTAVLDDQVVLPFVLQQAWDRSIILFSSTLAHVRRGALFALYPDNVDMGHQLATSALALMEAARPRRTVQPVRELRLALNTRTAGHLGLNLEAVQNDAVLLFPVR